jgi:diamine N-acetyltransferase
MDAMPEDVSGPASKPDLRPALNVVGELVALGPLRRDLIPSYQRWINDFETTRTLAVPPRPVTQEQETRWYEQAISSEHDVSFTVYERATLRPVGVTGLHGIDFRDRRANFGIMIGEPGCRGKGYGTEATRLMLDYAFTALGLHSVMLTVYQFNPAGKRAYEKAGFKEFGRRRQCHMMGGRLWDEIFMECLSTEFESPTLGRIFAPDPRR